MWALGPALFVEPHDAQQLSGFAEDVLELGVLAPAGGAALLFEALDQIDEGVGFWAQRRRKAASSGDHGLAPWLPLGPAVVVAHGGGAAFRAGGVGIMRTVANGEQVRAVTKRDQAWAAFFHRRHLNTAQRALAAFNLFGEQAKIEAAKAKIQTVGRPNKLRGNFPSISQNRDDYKWQGIAAKKANEVGLNVKPDAIKAMATIALAPQAIATIERGEIKTITKAHEKALEELRRPPTKLPQTADSLSIDRRLGRCITDLTAIIRDTDGEAPIGSTFSISEKVDQIERLIAKVRYALRARNVIY